eukprot:COSAG02_NODE_1684_length_11324_cov_8.190111_9_plen_419_part_00
MGMARRRLVIGAAALSVLAASSVADAVHMIAPWGDKEHAPTLYGNTQADAYGLHFGAGEHYGGDFAAVHMPVDNQHLQSGTFTLVIWARKYTCETGGIYEYLFSEASGSPGDSEDAHRHSWGYNGLEGLDDLVAPWVSAYIGCERQGSGYSNLAGTILRYLLEDNNYHPYYMDVQLAAAGAFDDIAGVWQHHVLSVQSSALSAYLDGTPQTVGFFQGGGPQNKAYPDPANLQVPVGSFVGINTIVLGARHDLDPNRYLHGSLGLVALFDRTLTAPEVLELSMVAADSALSLRPHVCCSGEALSHLAANNTVNPFLWQGGLDHDGNGNVTWFLTSPQPKQAELDDCFQLSPGLAWIVCEGFGPAVGLLVVCSGLSCLCWTRQRRDHKEQPGKDGAPHGQEAEVIHAVVIESPVAVEITK